MKRIWFTQQKPFGYIPLRLGLVYIIKEQADSLTKQMYPCRSGFEFCPKLYTTRTHPLSGEYCVVAGSRFKAVPVEPGIEFCIAKVWELNLRSHTLCEYGVGGWLNWEYSILDEKAPFRPHYSFPELDLGIKGATFEQLRDELLRLNPKATIDTTFYVSRLEPIGVRV